MYGQILRNLRIDNGLTQQQLADILGFKSASAIGMLEREERELSVEFIIRAANYFNVSTDYLLGVAPSKNELGAKVLIDTASVKDPEEYPSKTSFGSQFHSLSSQRDDNLYNLVIINKLFMDAKFSLDFENAEHALKFILSQPVIADYLEYDLKHLSDDEILKIADYMLFAAKLRLEELKIKNKRTSKKGI